MKKYISILLAIASMLMYSCNKSPENDTIIVGTSGDNRPYEFIDEKHNLVGFDIDFIKEVAALLGKKAIIKNMDFNALMPALNSKHIDLIVAALTKNQLRSAIVDFSDVYADSNIAVLTLKKNNINNFNDLTGKKLGVQLGSSWEMIAKEVSKKVANLEIHSLNSNLVLIEELKKGNIEAILMENLQVHKLMELNSEFSGFAINGMHSEFAIALPKNSELKIKIDEAIATLKSNGKLQELKDKWLDVSAQHQNINIPYIYNDW